MKIEKVLDLREALRLVKEFEKLLMPSLSQRGVDIDAYTEKILQYGNLYSLSNDKNESMGLSAAYMNDHTEKTAYLTMLAVKNNYRGCGVGKRLLFVAEEEARKCGMECCRLEVRKNNMNAIGFYKAHGYIIIGEASQTSYYMLKEL